MLLKAAVISYPASLFFAENLALVAHEVGDLVACREGFDRARRLGSEAKLLRLMEPDLLLKEGETTAAAEAAMLLVEADPSDEDALRAAAPILEAADHPAAILAWRGLEALVRLSSAELLRAARAARAAGSPADAQHFLDQILRRHPEHREALIEKTSLSLAVPEGEGFEALAALRSLADEKLDIALELLPFLMQEARWDALLLLARRASEAGRKDAFAELLRPLARSAARAEKEGREPQACQVFLALSLLTQGVEAAAYRERARRSMTVALGGVRAAMGAGNMDTAKADLARLMTVAEAGGPAPRDLASLAETLEAPALAARAWLCVWREDQKDWMLTKAAEAGLRADSPGAALALAGTIPNLPRDHPVIAHRILRLARAADAALLESGGRVEADLVLAARALLAPDAPEGWPQRGARDYVRRLRQAMKDASQSGDGALAIATAEALVVLDPTKAHPFKVLARLHAAGGNATRAQECLLELTRLEPENVDNAVRFARRHRPEEERTMVLDVLVRGLDQHPGHTGLHQALDAWLTEPPSGSRGAASRPARTR